MTSTQSLFKRSVDFSLALIGLIVTAPVVILAVLLVRLSSGEPGLFWQIRVGRYGKEFWVVKIRTMTERQNNGNYITVRGDSRVTCVGRLLRRTKIDELPQLWNVFKGEMSLVGPRPDVPDQMKLLNDTSAAIVLSVRPGITGPASIRYRREEELLSLVSESKEFNDGFVFPDKTNMNIAYVTQYSLLRDFFYMMQTICLVGPSAEDLLFDLWHKKPLLDCDAVSDELYREKQKVEQVA